jgi:hypothetical protein
MKNDYMRRVYLSDRPLIFDLKLLGKQIDDLELMQASYIKNTPLWESIEGILSLLGSIRDIVDPPGNDQNNIGAVRQKIHL